MATTLKSIADELGLSKTTISAVLNGHAAKFGICESTVNRVLELCAARKYSININARRINSKMKRNIAVVVSGEYHEILNPLVDRYAAMALGGAAVKGRSEGFSTSLIICKPDDSLESLLGCWHGKEVDGFIFVGFPLKEAWTEHLLKERIPSVVIGGDPACRLPTVNIDNRLQSYEIARRMLAKGRRRFALLAGGSQSYVARERRKGFEMALAEAGVTPVFEFDCQFHEEAAFRCLKESAASALDAVFAVNDAMAIGALRALKERGLRVPEDVSLSGADGSPVLAFITPSLCTYPLLAHEQGQAAFSLLKQVVERKRWRHVELKSTLQEGGSL